MPSASVMWNTICWELVSASIMARSDSDPAAVYTVSKNIVVVSTVTVDRRTVAFRWGSINNGMSIAAGNAITVELMASGSGCARADAV
jgi:hypothetical protein